MVMERVQATDAPHKFGYGGMMGGGMIGGGFIAFIPVFFGGIIC